MACLPPYDQLLFGEGYWTMDWQTIGTLLFIALMVFCCGGMMMGGMKSRRKKSGHDAEKPTSQSQQDM